MATTTSTRTTAINVKLTPTYALTADANNFVIQRQHFVDPTKSPNFNAEKAVSTDIREEWRDCAFFSLTSAGLAAALDYVRIKTVANSGITDLTELVALIQSETAALVDAVNGAVKLPKITVEIDA